MVIDAKGNYFRARGYMTMDYNIGEKVNNKEFLLRNALEEQMKNNKKKIVIICSIATVVIALGFFIFFRQHN